jgi:arylformamidase
MKIYDISQELLSCEVYPGDPHPVLNKIVSIQAGDAYNLSTLSLCTHNGTHVDAPSHFIDKGKTVGEMDLSRLVGESYVTEHEGEVGESEVRAILAKARAHGSEAKRILIKGDATVTAEGARTLLAEGVVLVGVESQSVGPADTPMEVHKILLGGEVVLLEGIRLSNVSEGAYFLFCAPINVGISDGAPCRAVLVDFAE